ncbi:DNA/RNA helicase domain-containing protein [Moritella viscosa]|uniref:Schlafen group 3-like DNA/RNA helicase domain-containing protein n=2 Tax=Moritella viscosa TaxID=80854 RepID=A0ABY1HCF0_9GAMM|nr:DNA/RNA helicase domain-containing protein [Moritella viscosa]SGY84994.1 Putative uncharacterized protein [Moritella viscosa]SGZ18927.1 Putative uncharacterized protein [Moritella viscosa]SHO28482.1 Putative uncharacterized protein [Moritella viscosa]
MDLSKTGWAGTWTDFLDISKDCFVNALESFYAELPWTKELSPSQGHAWTIEYDVMQATLAKVIVNTGINPSLCWVAFEQELVGEGGKRAADVNIVLPTGDLFVVEFKHKVVASQQEVTRALFDLQTMINFHSESHQLTGHCYLALTKIDANIFEHDSVICDIASNCILPKLVDGLGTALQSEHHFDVSKWQHGTFNRQPSIIHGTVRVFYDNDIPNLKTEAGENIEQARENLVKLYQHAKENQLRYVVVINGRPGAGKTLLGISAVADLVTTYGSKNCKPLFLSGNKPLVQVLQHTLDYYGALSGKELQIDGRSIIQHLIDFKRDIKKKDIKKKSREENFVVFDEAQRAWGKVSGGGEDSELDVFCRWLAHKEFGVLVLLVGDGQAIHKNEMSLENMMISLGDAIRPFRDKLTPIMPAIHAHFVKDINPNKRDMFYLKTPIRQNYTDELDHWIEAVLNNNDQKAYEIAKRIHSHYPLYITTSKGAADEYVRTLQLALHEDNKKVDAFRVGWLKSSKSNKNDSELTELKDNFGAWYVDAPNSPLSCCQLQTACTEFSCQGLELSIALLEWGPDLQFRNGALNLSENRYYRRDIDDYTYGSYRVLLSRGRTGLVVKCGDQETYQYLLRCGMAELR